MWYVTAAGVVSQNPKGAVQFHDGSGWQPMTNKMLEAAKATEAEKPEFVEVKYGPGFGATLDDGRKVQVRRGKFGVYLMVVKP